MPVLKNITVISVNVKEWEGAKKFYDQLLDGWPVAWSNDELGWREYGRDGEAHISIQRVDGAEAPAPGLGPSTIVFTVDDAHQTVTALRGLGVRCDDPIGIPGVVTYANFYDPEGNRHQVAGPPPQ